MPTYTCKCCDFTTHIKTHYASHLKTKKHQKCSYNVALCSPTIENYPAPEKTYPCKHCDKVFKHSSSLYRHIKSSCQKNNDSNGNELIQLITEKYNQIENMQKQIDFLTNKIQNQETNSF